MKLKINKQTNRKYYQSHIKTINGNDTALCLFIIFDCLLSFIYTGQFANVKLGNFEVSSIFTMKRGWSYPSSLIATT